MSQFLPYILGFVLFSGILAVGLFAQRRSPMRARLDQVLAVGGPVVASHASMRSTDDLQKRLKEAEKRAADGQAKPTMAQRLAEAGFSITPKKFDLLSLGSASALSGFAQLTAGKPVLLVSAFIIGGLALPRLVVRIAAGRRKSAFLRDLPDALEGIVRAIRSGLPVSECLGMIARDFSGPISLEFGRAFDEQKLGLSLAECLGRIADRMPLPEMRMMAMAVGIQAQTGGSLAETLTNLANVIRGRTRLARKVKAVSSEAKVSAMIMGCLPLFIMGSLGAINPTYIALLWTDPLGRVLTGFCVVWMSMGVLVMWKMVNFKV
jgi:tight adherence protein B